MAGTKSSILSVFNRHIPSMLDVKYHLPSFNGKHSMETFRVFLEHPAYVSWKFGVSFVRRCFRDGNVSSIDHMAKTGHSKRFENGCKALT